MSHLRSIVLLCSALFASVFLFAIPASASISLYHSDGPVLIVKAQPHDLAQDIADLSAALDKMAFQVAVTAAILNSDHDVNLGRSGAGRTPFGLRPEYALSLKTDGHNFIDLRRRC